MGGGDLDHLVIIVSAMEYSVVDTTMPWINPELPGRSPATIENGNVAEIGPERHRWEESTATLKSYNTLEKAL